MHAHKIMTAILALALLAACSDGNSVPKTDYDDLKKEYEELRERHDKTRGNYMEQSRQMDDILSELSAISGRTNSLRLDLENGTARITEAEQIQNHITGIKEKIETLTRLAADDKSGKKMVETLKKVIDEKEQEISVLKREILRKDETIRAQGEKIERQEGTIDEQLKTISAQEERLRQRLVEQAAMLLQAGKDFETLADASPSVSWKKNKQKVGDWTLEMYNKAMTYYLNARDAGNDEAPARIESLKGKIAEHGRK